MTETDFTKYSLELLREGEVIYRSTEPGLRPFGDEATWQVVRGTRAPMVAPDVFELVQESIRSEGAVEPATVAPGGNR